MITLLGTPRRCCDGVTRRETLQAGALSALGVSLPTLLAAEEARTRPRRREGQERHPALPARRRGDAGHDRPQAERPAEVARRVQADRDQRARHPHLRTPAADGAVDAQDRAWSARSITGRLSQHAAELHRASSRSLDDIVSTTRHLSAEHGLGVRVPARRRAATAQLPDYVYMPCYLGWGQAIRRPGPYARLSRPALRSALHRSASPYRRSPVRPKPGAPAACCAASRGCPTACSPEASRSTASTRAAA